MTRAQRLLELLQILRRHRYPARGAALASELGISLRSVYRDIATLQAQGARIEGAAGLGYQLRAGFMLPPLMFTEDEIAALVLGTNWVAERADAPLGKAALNALAKIGAVLPPELREDLANSALLVGSVRASDADEPDLTPIRRAIRGERKLELRYRSGKDAETRRIVWPIALAFFEEARVMVAWCELRQDFRHFRTDRIEGLQVLEERYPRRRQALLKKWREIEGVPAPRA